jgi:hypothetical protein
MFPLSHKHLTKFAVAGAFLALTAVSFSIPASAGELVENSGPVGPHEPILTTFGNKRVIAFYEPEIGHCALNAVVYDITDPDTGTTTAARVRISLSPGQTVHIDSTDNKTINLRCADEATALGIVDNDELVASDRAIQQLGQPIRANASGF